MSKAGIQSNRGDGYQTLVAFDWALTVLSDPDTQWLEVDAVACPVDDVVIGNVDGTRICCQCKKNQPQHKSWSIADLKDELRKAGSLLASDSATFVRFYSRSAFGDIAKLREYSTNYRDESTYLCNLPKGHQNTDEKLARVLADQLQNISTYQFLQRTKYEISPDLDRMETLLRERLRGLVSNHSEAFDALWRRLDQLGMRENGGDRCAATKHRLTKDGLKSLLGKAGAILAPPMDIEEIRVSFKSTSAIGRSWRRDIGNEYVSSPVVNELIEAIESKNCSILLTGLPGSGKTCVMLAVQDELERLAQNRTDLIPLFIQAREFANIITVQDRKAQGLSENWVERAARMAEDAKVVVMIDSLDVLSIAREHSALTYFLAQIDRLLLIPTVTVVTACRDFDSRFDRRIAQRRWGIRITCPPLEWDVEIAPLLTKLGIDASTIDSATRELIRNPRQFALFVELAQQEGGFNVVTSQALAQRYLTTVVQANSALGDVAMRAIEALAAEMLKSRSVGVPDQRFSASQEVKWALLSHNVLHETHDGQLIFGHQTLLDVLVISGAIRQAITLNMFIQSLPPVPFVRPSIRSFAAHLATGDRNKYRKQLRTALTGSNAFHLRRLLAETFAEHAPHDDDWHLILDLRNRHRDVFQVIYAKASGVEWHHFWMKHLVPVLKDTQDTDGLVMHVHQVSQWKNDDAEGVSRFWVEVLSLTAVDKIQLVHSLAHAITQIYADSLNLYVPLLIELLKVPRHEHSFLGNALAYYVLNDAVDDAVLWRYIAGEVSDKDVLAFHFDNKLHCKPNEFGNGKGNFLIDRMQESTALLDLAVASIERWSQVRASRDGRTEQSYVYGFLGKTSYDDSHSQTYLRHVDSERILLDAVETAIVYHANAQSLWWQSNRGRLCSSTEGSLRYFAILACTAAPAPNLDVIGRMLCDKVLLNSELSYELGTLMQTAFVHLDSATQDTIQMTILTVREEYATDLQRREWMLRAQAQLILAIPCHLRFHAAHAVLYECRKLIWPLVRQPRIHSRGGVVGAPFSFDVFLDACDNGVLRLLAHYDGYERHSYDDFLVGGEREVGCQLREAASRHPARFINLLLASWNLVPGCFRDDIMGGVAAYLAHRYGNLQPTGEWGPKYELDAAALVQLILDELERHSIHWHHNRAASDAIENCAHVVTQVENTTRLISLAMEYSTLQEESSAPLDSENLLNTGINMVRGNAAESLMILANRLEDKTPWPESLPSALRLFASDGHPSIRALLLRRLPHFQSHHFALGWELFGLIMQKDAIGLWAIAEPCLYYTYYQNFEIVAPLLARLYCEGSGKDFGTWGVISALAAFSKRVDFSAFLKELKAVDAEEAWHGAARVWTNPSNVQQHRVQCFAGLEEGLSVDGLHAVVVARRFCLLFREVTPLVLVPVKLVRRYFCLLETETEFKRSDNFGFDVWLNAVSLRDPMYALEVTEIYLGFIRRTQSYVHDQENNFTQLLTRLFAQAEEQEESDSGTMLQRVVVIQDALLALGVSGVDAWLEAAERP